MTSIEQRRKSFDGRKQDHGDAAMEKGHYRDAFEESWDQRGVNSGKAQHKMLDLAQGLHEYSNPITPEELEAEANRWLGENGDAYDGMRVAYSSESEDEADVYGNSGSINAIIADLLKEHKDAYADWIKAGDAIEAYKKAHEQNDDSEPAKVPPELLKSKEEYGEKVESIEDMMKAIMSYEDAPWVEEDFGLRPQRAINRRQALIDTEDPEMADPNYNDDGYNDDLPVGLRVSNRRPYPASSIDNYDGKK